MDQVTKALADAASRAAKEEFEKVVKEAVDKAKDQILAELMFGLEKCIRMDVVRRADFADRIDIVVSFVGFDRGLT